MHKIRWTPVNNVSWMAAQETNVHGLWLLVGIISGWTWGVFKYRGGPRITGGNCGSLEEAIASAEDWVNANLIDLDLLYEPLCQECWTRHKSDKPCYNG